MNNDESTSKDFVMYPWDNDICINKDEKQVIIGARKCELKTPSLKELDDFLNKYHYQKTCNGQTYRYGLYYNDKLIGVMTFGKARYTKHAQYELLRLCFHSNYKIIGGSQKLFNAFIKEYNPNSIISYCDKSKFTGKVYETLGMKIIQKGLPRDHYWRETDKKHISQKQLVMFGPDKLIGTSYGKGTNNKEIMLKEGFTVIKDKGQDAYLYLNDNAYFGYIYMTTDTTNGKKYIGQHIASKFDPKYYGSGTIISNVIKDRKDKLKLEVLEWCKQNISDRELYWINYYNTVFPNGYNLSDRKQWFTFNDPEKLSIKWNDYYNGEKAEEHRKLISERLLQFYNTEEGKKLAKQITKKRLAFNQTPEGKECIEKAINKYKTFCYTEDGEKMRKERRKKQIEYNQTEEGKVKEKNRIQALRDFYNSEEGKKAKEQQVAKYKANLNTEEGQKKRKEQAQKYSDWSKTPEGQAILKASAAKSHETYRKNMEAKINAMSEQEWEDYLKAHPKTSLKKYRK